jgi:hypothetical protein
MPRATIVIHQTTSAVTVRAVSPKPPSSYRRKKPVAATTNVVKDGTRSRKRAANATVPGRGCSDIRGLDYLPS